MLKLILGLACCFATAEVRAGEILIEENQIGFCAVDGQVLTSVEGYTGSGYADTDIGPDHSGSWSVSAASAGVHALVWRYGNGGGDLGYRPGRLVLNGEVARESLSFPHTGDWTNWMETDTVWVELAEGYNSIRLEALSASGLGNIDYLKVAGADIAPASCVPIYVLEVGQNDPRGIWPNIPIPLIRSRTYIFLFPQRSA